MAFVLDNELLTLDGVLGDMAAEPTPTASPAVEHMYKPSESIFGAVAKGMVARGWSVFPQELDGNRRPGKASGEIIKWSEDHNLAERLPTPAALDLWVRECASLNVATVFGPASGHTFALDIDVLDHELSARLVELADRILGYTPFRRIGLAPKIALLYRHKPDETVPSISRRFMVEGADGKANAGEDGVEILSRGKLLTFWGKHHKTGRYFIWPDLNPFDNGPDKAPEVTLQQVNEWIEAADSVRRFHRGASFDVDTVEWSWDESAGLHVPTIQRPGAGIGWVEDENGKVVDGREDFLFRLVHRATSSNPAACGSEAGIAKIMGMVRDQFYAHAEVSGRWSGGRLDREIKTKVRHAAEKVKRGEIKSHAPVQDEKGDYIKAANSTNWIPARPSTQGETDSLDFLPPATDPEKYALNPSVAPRKPFKCFVHPPKPEAAKERAIPADRSPATRAVQTSLKKAFDAFFSEIYARDPRDQSSIVHILKAPTGAGKTSQAIRYIAKDPRTKEDHAFLAKDGTVQRARCPILFLLPTYNNIEELRTRSEVLNLDANMPDDEFRKAAEEKGLISADDLDAKVAELKRDAENAGLVTMVYKGKIAAGCQMSDKVGIAMAAGVGTQGFCRTETRQDDGEIEEKLCPYYHGCPAITQRDQISQSHVVFMPHPFMALTIPEELKHVRAVVADERIHHLFLHTATFKLATLEKTRKQPRLTKKEREKGLMPEDLAVDRNDAAEVARHALQRGECPAEALFLHESARGKQGEIGFRLVESALKVCSSAIQRDATITPELTLEEVQALCALPTGEEIREEYRFWKIIQERMQALMHDNIWAKDVAECEAALASAKKDSPDEKQAHQRMAKLMSIRRAKGSREMRIQFQLDDPMAQTAAPEAKPAAEQAPKTSPEGKQSTQGAGPSERVRISWRQEPNWNGIPLLLLDASAAPEVIRKIWGDADVEVHDITAPLNVRVVGIVDRTYSNASVVAPANATPAEQADTAVMLAKIRRTVNLLSCMYGWGRVVAGASIAVRRAVNYGWVGPDNVDWCHYGAMRGLDFAKFHAAAVSVGRMEVPIRTIDGLVAALSYDDDMPEEPFDRFGTGLTQDGKPLRLPMGAQRLKMRSGHDVEIAVPMFPGKWGRLIQKQYREEEQIQFLGRLRPVYRKGEAPIWFAMSSVIPDDVIVDDLIKLDELLKTERDDLWLWEAARRTRGILHPDLIMKHCADLYECREHAEEEMEIAGFGARTGQMEGRLCWGFVAVEWTDVAGGGKDYAFVRADLKDPAAIVRHAMKELGRRVTGVSALSKPRERTLARGRKEPDNIDKALGDENERRSLESEISAFVNEQVLDTPFKPSRGPEENGRYLLPVRMPTPIKEGVEKWLTYAEMEARESTIRMWRAVAGKSVAATAQTSVLPDSGENFDHLGTAVDDMDEELIPW